MDPTVNACAVALHKSSFLYCMDEQGMPFNPYQDLPEDVNLITAWIRQGTVYMGGFSDKHFMLEADRNTPPQISTFACSNELSTAGIEVVARRKKRAPALLVCPRPYKSLLQGMILPCLRGIDTQKYARYVRESEDKDEQKTCNNILLTSIDRLVLGRDLRNDGDKPNPNVPKPEKPKPDKSTSGKEGGKESERVKEPKTKEMP
jgi:hypothetical protein